MKPKLIGVQLSVVMLLMVSSCATEQVVPTEPLKPGEVRLLSIAVKDKDIRENAPILVAIKFEADGKPEIKKACLSFSAKGPYCTDVKDYTYGSPGIIWVPTTAIIAEKVKEFNLHTVVLKGYIFYEREGKSLTSNAVSTFIQVSKVE
jgi:hypothetical protein